MQSELLALIEQHESYLKKANMIFSVLGYVKLFLVLLTGILIYFVFSKGFPTGFILSCAVAFAILVMLWVYHGKIHERIKYSKEIISICNRQIDRIIGKWTTFDDTGTEFVDAEHTYACDLDIVSESMSSKLLPPVVICEIAVSTQTNAPDYKYYHQWG